MTLNSLLSRQGRVILALGADLMGCQFNDRLPTVQEFASRYEASVGTVQKALSYLQAENYVQLQARGHQGTYLVEINRRALWKLIHPGDLVGAMPLPYSPRYEGLATALSDCLRDAGLLLNLVFMRGAITRLQAMKEKRCDFVVLSALALSEAFGDTAGARTVINLGNGTYVGEHVLVFRDSGCSEIEPGMRVGIDPKSIDQDRMCRQACEGKAVSFIEISYMQLPAALQRGLIDATVWNRDELKDRYPILHETVRSPEPAANPINTQACIVAETVNLSALLRECIDPDQIRNIQSEVMAGTRMPSY